MMVGLLTLSPPSEAMVGFSKWVPKQGKLFDTSMVTKSRRYVSGAISLSKVDERRDNKMQFQRHVWMWESNKVC